MPAKPAPPASSAARRSPADLARGPRASAVGIRCLEIAPGSCLDTAQQSSSNPTASRPLRDRCRRQYREFKSLKRGYGQSDPDCRARNCGIQVSMINDLLAIVASAPAAVGRAEELDLTGTQNGF